ncbi:MAG TPA: hypothetical protein VF984_05930 [Actinomycetota bacterium]
MDFSEALRELGFHPSTERAPRGAAVSTAKPNRYTTYTVQALEDGTALFTWEFAVGDYLATRGIQLGSDETLNQFMFPRDDERGPQDASWLVAAVEHAETALRRLRFDRPDQ